MRIGVHKVPMNSPNDVSGLERLIKSGAVNPSEIVALIGKTEGATSSASETSSEEPFQRASP